mgnify:CR=1 FL=1
MQKKADNNISKTIARLIKAKGFQWRMLLARDYSDRILTFHSDVKVHTDGKLLVEETIIVYNGNGSSSPDID